ncbi:MAG: translation elongation factor Ts [Bifidobacteriaceae bacterium]|jgi:elongation factor Ts|nr:translation elongation factor Ts [Bifidobacteriaceae bacterium]
MADYTLNDIKLLREKTGAGMLDIKKALTEAEGDIKKAIEIIRIKGLKGIAKREDRDASEGLVAAEIVESADKQVGYVVELNSETDFVAKSERFIALADKILKAVVAADVDSAEKALEAKTEDGTVQDSIALAAASMGEKIVLSRVKRIEGKAVTVYLHRTQKDLPPAIAALVATDDNAKSIAKTIAQHIAAYSPKFLSREQVPQDVLDDETRVAEETARAEGKPDKIIPNIVQGRLQGFYKETVLLDQPLAIDPKKSVQKFVEEVNGEVTDYIRIRVGN